VGRLGLLSLLALFSQPSQASDLEPSFGSFLGGYNVVGCLAYGEGALQYCTSRSVKLSIEDGFLYLSIANKKVPVSSENREGLACSFAYGKSDCHGTDREYDLLASVGRLDSQQFFLHYESIVAPKPNNKNMILDLTLVRE
jgi:hypothetical protein